MSPTEHTALTGAISGRVAVFAIGPVAVTIAQLMAKHEPFDFAITSIGVGDDVAEHVATGLGTHPHTAAPASNSVLLIGDTTHAALTTLAVQALAGDRGPNTRLRVWPVFVNGDPTKLTEFDAALDELPDTNCDAVLMLTRVPSPEQAARALLAWLTVKLPAPASVLGQMPDAAGRICRYVALGSELLAAPSGAGEVADGVTGDNADGTVTSGSPADREPADAPEASALLGRFRTVLNDLPGMVALRDSQAAVDAAMQAADLTAVIEAHQKLVMAGDAEVRAQLEALAADLIATAGRESESGAEGGASDGDGPGPATNGTADTSGPQVAAPSLATALAEYVVVAGKTGFGRMVSGGRRRQAAASLTAAADAFVAGVERAWIVQGEQALQAAGSAAAEQALATAAIVAATASAARATAAEASWRERVESAVATGSTWQGVDASRVVRSWGAGAAAARRYVIGSGELLDAAIDLTDGSGPCLRVLTPTTAASVTVLTAQYGLPLSALS